MLGFVWDIDTTLAVIPHKCSRWWLRLFYLLAVLLSHDFVLLVKVEYFSQPVRFNCFYDKKGGSTQYSQ
jgi:hypothetical protein